MGGVRDQGILQTTAGSGGGGPSSDVNIIGPIPLPTTTDGLTNTQLRATPVPVSGPLTNVELRTTPVPVSGPLTNTELRSTPVPISGAVTTGGLTNTELRATPVPVSTGDLTDAQLRANPVYVGSKSTYAAKATITVTLTSLTNGSGRESTVVDNVTNRYRDALIRFITKGQTSGTSVINVYVYESLGDSNYVDLATGSDAAFTAANRFNARFLIAIQMNAGTSAVTACAKLSDIFKTIPDKWGLIFINNSGAALSATAGDHVIEYEGVY